MRYLFTLGHQPHISTAELEAVFSRMRLPYEIISRSAEHLIVETDKTVPAPNLIHRLGGTVQIAEAVKIRKNPTDTIVNFLTENSEGKIHFSVSGKNATHLALGIKKELKSQGKSVRYIEIKNTATILYNNLIDKKSHFTIVENEVFVTTAIQDIEDFSKRDFDRPGSDSISGMLPPKLARSMINLSQTSVDDTLLDPFCGSGTILTEALSLGFTNLIGSDLSQKAVDDTKKNIEWFVGQSSNTATFDLSSLRGDSVEPSRRIQQYSNIATHLSDATTLSSLIKPNSVSAIISEPYMGKPLRGSETKSQLEKQVDELASLYIDSFEQFHKILKKDGLAIFIIPKFKCNNEWVTIECLEQIKKIGFELVPFNSEHTSLLYHRPKQFVGREIWKMRKNDM